MKKFTDHWAHGPWTIICMECKIIQTHLNAVNYRACDYVWNFTDSGFCPFLTKLGAFPASSALPQVYFLRQWKRSHDPVSKEAFSCILITSCYLYWLDVVAHISSSKQFEATP